MNTQRTRLLPLAALLVWPALLTSCVSMSAKSRLITKSPVVLDRIAVAFDARRFTENNEAARFGNRSTNALFAALREQLPAVLAEHGVSNVEVRPPAAASAPALETDQKVLALKSTHATHDRNGTDGELYVRAELFLPGNGAPAWWSEIRVQATFAGPFDARAAEKLSRELIGRMRADGIQIGRAN